MLCALFILSFWHSCHLSLISHSQHPAWSCQRLVQCCICFFWGLGLFLFSWGVFLFFFFPQEHLMKSIAKVDKGLIPLSHIKCPDPKTEHCKMIYTLQGYWMNIILTTLCLKLLRHYILWRPWHFQDKCQNLIIICFDNISVKIYRASQTIFLTLYFLRSESAQDFTAICQKYCCILNMNLKLSLQSHFYPLFLKQKEDM